MKAEVTAPKTREDGRSYTSARCAFPFSVTIPVCRSECLLLRSNRIFVLAGDYAAQQTSCFGPCRALRCEREILHRADGSAQWEQGGTKVLAAVYGPMSTLARKEDPERAIIEVTFKQPESPSGIFG